MLIPVNTITSTVTMQHMFLMTFCYNRCKFVLMFRLMTTEEKRMADMEAAIESKDSRMRAMLKEKEDKILRVSGCISLYLYVTV